MEGFNLRMPRVMLEHFSDTSDEVFQLLTQRGVISNPPLARTGVGKEVSEPSVLH